MAPLAIVIAFGGVANATCDRDRLHVVRSEGAPGGVQIFDLAPAAVQPTYYFRFRTTNAQIVDNLNAAWVGRFTVRIQGNADSCPASGVVREGGTITYLFRDSFF